MILVGASMVKNCEDVIESFARHNLQFLDALVVIDNGSSDATRAILDALIVEGLPVVVLDDPEFAYYQSKRMTDLCRLVGLATAADFVFPLDDDEFIRASSRSDLELELSTLGQLDCALVPVQNYIPHAAGSGAFENPLASITMRLAVEDPQLYKVWIPKRVVQSETFFLEQGNHDVGEAAQAHRVVLECSRIAHFPVRSPEQIVAKAIGGWLSYVARGDVDAHTMGFHWRRMYERFLNEPDIAWSDLTELAANYARPEGAALLTLRDCVDDPVPSVTHPVHDVRMRRSILAGVVSDFERVLQPPDVADAPVLRYLEKRYPARAIREITVVDDAPFWLEGADVVALSWDADLATCPCSGLSPDEWDVDEFATVGTMLVRPEDDRMRMVATRRGVVETRPQANVWAGTAVHHALRRQYVPVQSTVTNGSSMFCAARKSWIAWRQAGSA